MKAAVTCVLALACATSAFAQTATKADTERALIANENRIAEAIAKGDAATFTSMLTPDSMAGDMNGFIKAAEFVGQLGQLKLSTWKISDTRVQWIDEKTAVLMYTWTGKGTFQGQPIPEKVYASTIWTERTGKWLAAFHQETTAAPPQPPTKK